MQLKIDITRNYPAYFFKQGLVHLKFGFVSDLVFWIWGFPPCLSKPAGDVTLGSLVLGGGEDLRRLVKLDELA